MQFNRYHFLAFFIIVLFLTHLFQHDGKKQKLILLVASYYFYGQFSVKYLLLILTTTVVDFYVGQRIYRQFRPKVMLTFSLVTNLGILCLFKYIKASLHGFFFQRRSFGLSGIF